MRPDNNKASAENHVAEKMEMMNQLEKYFHRGKGDGFHSHEQQNQEYLFDKGLMLFGRSSKIMCLPNRYHQLFILEEN